MKTSALTVVGLGCGAPDLLTQQARDAMQSSDALFVMKNYSDLGANHPNFFVMNKLRDALGAIRSALESGENVAVGVSGDPGIFSFLSTLKKEFADMPGVDFRVVPGVGSLNYFFARLGESWNDAEILSGHGRELREATLLSAVTRSKKTVVFCDKTRSPLWVCEALENFRREFMDDEDAPLRAAVGADLSLASERVVSDTLPEILDDVREIGGHALVAVFNDGARPISLAYPTDGEFIRTDIPMTRQEVRAAILGELGISRDSVVWDVGAGTGSVSVACARLCPDGEVHAVERLPDAVALIRANRKKFKAVNLYVHEGDAPDALRGLPTPTHVFVGGSGGRLGDVLKLVSELGGGIKICVSSVTVETGAIASAVMTDAEKFQDLSVLNVAVTRSRSLGASGGPLLMAAQNPVTLWTAVTVKTTEEVHEST